MPDVSLALAFAAGLLSFVSPCVLALVPVYVAFLGEAAGGVQVGDGTLAVRRPILAQALLFVAGFTAVFVLLGTSVGLIGSALFRIDQVRVAAGLAVIAIGLLTTGLFEPITSRLRIALPAGVRAPTRVARATTLGALVAIGWTPCIGPVLGVILTMGASSQSVLAATVLLLAYSLGLAVPFLAAALALPRLRPLFDWLRRHERAVQLVSGLFIALVGVLIVTNAFARLAGLFVFFI